VKLRYTIMYVEDVSKTLAFYEKAFNLQRTLLHDSGDYGELNTGDTKLAFSSVQLMTTLGKKPGQPDSKAPVFEIAFETDNVQAALDTALRAGATLIQEVREEPWGQITAYVADMNGYLVEICSPVQTQS
jgi:lactoylglutathione lyase